MHPPPLLLAEKKRSAVHGVGEEEALVQTKMDPCSDKMVSCKVASVCKVGTNQNAPSFSFRCRWPGTRPIRGSPGAGGAAPAGAFRGQPARSDGS